MDDVTVAILAVVLGACVGAVVAAADKRCLRHPPKAPMTFKVHAFETALRTPGTGWFHKKLRCDKESFLRIYALVHAAWGREPGPNCKNQVIKRVALTMLYLAQRGTMDQAAAVMGVSRPRAVVYINETLDVLSAMAKRFIVMPSADELPFVEDGFFATTGFPDTVGEVDGALVRIARPHDFEGWISSYVPPGKHNVGDAGYKIWGHMLTPFSEGEAVQARRKRLYNYVHSKTRIVVECAFGHLKNRFRVLLGKLEQKSADCVCKIEGVDPLLREAPTPVAEDLREREQAICHEQGIAKHDATADILMGVYL
ncbi:hypothetical protein PI125_g19252 [Phytophthora idaei]|nr:hypothetical protein PI125_g19252 [Phytophthora idaei]KAG3162262.1 hypothetical protein PI126_g6049 [Phytophthora idaei]